MVLYPTFVVGILTVLFTVSEMQVFPVSAAVSDCWSSLESFRYTSCEFAMIERRIGSSLECWWYMSQFRRYQYFRLVDCHLGLSIRGSVGYDCRTFRCFVHIVINPCIGFGTTCVSVKPAQLFVLPVIWLPSWISSTHRRPRNRKYHR